MLDVHPPHKPMHGAGEFFLHLFTITVGLLIAVGIEGVVTWHEHRKLAEDARASLTAEIRENEARLKTVLKDTVAGQDRLNKNLDSVDLVLLHPGGKLAHDMSLDISYSTTSLENTAWHTAEATHALDYMPYEEAQRFSSIYDAQGRFEKAQEQWWEDEAQFLGLIRRYSPKDRDMTSEGAGAMAQQFGIWEGHLLNIDLSAKVLEDQTSAYLDGREPKKHMTEHIGN